MHPSAATAKPHKREPFVAKAPGNAKGVRPEKQKHLRPAAVHEKSGMKQPTKFPLKLTLNWASPPRRNSPRVCSCPQTTPCPTPCPTLYGVGQGGVFGYVFKILWKTHSVSNISEFGTTLALCNHQPSHITKKKQFLEGHKLLSNLIHTTPFKKCVCTASRLFKTSSI